MEAKKSLGQNFFVNEHLGDRIIETTLESNPETIVEIGPGRGFFTERLVNSGKNIIVIEKDNTLAKFLAEQFPNIEIVNKDFLDVNLKDLNLPKETVFFGSLPYNVSKPIIRNILESETFNMPAYFVIQKEVAEKYTADKPENNILSTTTQLHSKPKKLFDISKGSFRPVPKVTSSFIRFTPIDTYENFENRKGLEKLIKTSFSSPRKTVRNNIKTVAKGKQLESELLNKRPQQLSLEDFIELFTLLK